MIYVMIVSIALSAWALLRLIGGERARRLREIQDVIRAEAQAAAEAAAAMPKRSARHG